MTAHAEAPSASRSDREGFAELTAPHVPALRLHCYRLVGSLDDAEDMVQETLLRAWRHRDRLTDPGGIRGWLYRIATNACLDQLDRQRRRPAVRDVAGADWPDPLPDTWISGAAESADPAERLVERETVAHAFLAAVRILPPRQRAMLVLRDVLEWPVGEVAEALGTTSAAVSSALQRARATMKRRLPEGSVASDRDANAREVARRYLDAWERGDMAALAALLTADARMAMPPDPSLFEGREAIIGFFKAAIFSRPPASRIRLAPTRASGEPAFVVLEPDGGTGELRRIGIKVLGVRGRRIAEIRGYMRAGLADRFPPGWDP